jgi:hypothetical protein
MSVAQDYFPAVILRESHNFFFASASASAYLALSGEIGSEILL